jgi:signal transduction histidine kinase/CheY-like chemotaxis protein
MMDPSRKERVLVVDDEPHVARALTDTLGAQRLQRTDERLRVLAGVTRGFAEASADHAALLRSIAVGLADVIGDSCVVFLLSPGGTSVTAVAMHAVGAKMLADMQAVLDGRQLLLTEQPALRQVLTSGRPLLTPLTPLLGHFDEPSDTTTERPASREPGLHRCLVVALRVHGRSIGALSLRRGGARSAAFDELDVELAQILADHAALAIENARLVGEALRAHHAADAAESARDASELQRLQAEKRGSALKDRLRHAQKMEAVGRLAGGVAHDFNNVLSVILGYGEDMLSELEPDNALRSDIGEIVNAGSRAARLTKQLLLFSRQEAVESQVLALNDVIAGIDRMLLRAVGEHVQLVVTLAPELGRIRGDRSDLEQLLMNLVVNARDAMPNGGRLDIDTSNVMLSEAFVSEHLEVKPGPYVMLGVSDTGVGMDSHTRARVFEPFFTTKPAGAGTGFGLATVFGIVKQAGGTLQVHSEVGHGTMFALYFPRVDGDVETRAPILMPPQLGGNETVLLVEDDVAVRAIAQRILEKNGYRVLVADTVAEATRLAETYPERIDLLLTDVVMPGTTGPELAARSIGVRPDLRVLYMSGYSDGSAASRGVVDGDSKFLQKPFTGELLVRKVRGALDKVRR